jgi:hypothetical protein
VVVSPDDPNGFVRAAAHLAFEERDRIAMGRAARHHAEHAFDIDLITDRFELIFDDALREKKS